MKIELDLKHEDVAGKARARIQAMIAGTAFVSEALSLDAELSAPETVPTE